MKEAYEHLADAINTVSTVIKFTKSMSSSPC